MRKLLLSFGWVVMASIVVAADPEGKAGLPKGVLNETEEKFLGKWAGSRGVYKWEIHRKADRTFEIAFVEPDPDRFLGSLKNYGTGVWWVEGKEYKFEWTRWWGDEGDFGGLQTEIVDAAGEDRVVTLSDDDGKPENVELRTGKFKSPAWRLKPEEGNGGKDVADHPAKSLESKGAGDRASSGENG